MSKKVTEAINKITAKEETDRPDISDTLLRLQCVRIASGNYRRSDEIIAQAAELMSYIKTGAIKAG